MSFQQMIVRWLAAQAMQSVRQSAEQAIWNELSGKEPPEKESAETDRQPTCDDLPVKTTEKPDAETTDIGFVYAMPMEASGVVDLLKKKKTIKADGRIFHTGRFLNFNVAVVESGIGREKAARATEILVDVFKPNRIVSAGYGGALSKRLKRFDVCFPEAVVCQSDARAFDLSGDVPTLWEKPVERPIFDKFVLLTTDFVAATPTVKSRLNRQLGAEVVDMETHAVAEVCFARGIPFLAVRIILDTADEELPKDVQGIMKNAEIGGVRLVGSVLGSLFRRPSALIDLYTLKERALDATDRLAKRIASELDSNNTK